MIVERVVMVFGGGETLRAYGYDNKKRNSVLSRGSLWLLFYPSTLFGSVERENGKDEDFRVKELSSQ